MFTFKRDLGDNVSDKLKTTILLPMLPQDLQGTLVQHTDRVDNDRVARDKVPQTLFSQRRSPRLC